MANTITFGKLINSLEREFPRFKEESQAAEWVAKLINRVWSYGDFRETLADLPPFYLRSLVQYYDSKFYNVPVDFQSLKSAWLTEITDGSVIGVRRTPLQVITKQSGDIQFGIPEVLSYEPSQDAFKIFPILPEGTPYNKYVVEGTYKTLPKSWLTDTSGRSTPILATDIDSSNFTKVLLPLDDRHYEGMQYIMRALAKPVSNINEEIARNQFVDTLLREIAYREGYDLGNSLVSPLEPLSNYSSW